MNRYFRRMKRFASRRSQGEMADLHGKLFDASVPPDVAGMRAKSMGHRKKTADKWNQ
jgi:hypothetical protein